MSPLSNARQCSKRRDLDLRSEARVFRQTLSMKRLSHFRESHRKSGDSLIKFPNANCIRVLSAPPTKLQARTAIISCATRLRMACVARGDLWQAWRQVTTKELVGEGRKLPSIDGKVLFFLMRRVRAGFVDTRVVQ